jgi:hypothetical protein
VDQSALPGAIEQMLERGDGDGVHEGLTIGDRQDWLSTIDKGIRNLRPCRDSGFRLKDQSYREGFPVGLSPNTARALLYATQTTPKPDPEPGPANVLQ